MAAITGLYTQLELRNEGEIRLVKIAKSKDGDICCKLETVSIHKKPQYDAISYTWGPSTNEEAARGMTNTPTHRILCNDHHLLVPENLHAFLTKAAENTRLASKYMWIDSICIDQSAPLERTSQVKMMSNIYQSAATVVVWLGEEDKHTRGAFELIHVLGRYSENQLQEITPRNLNSTRTLQMLAPCGDISFWRSLQRLFQRRYFTRVWIIQEITLARERLTVCGQHMVNWDHVVKVSKFLTVTSWTRWICSSGMFSAVDSQQSNHAIPNLIDASKKTREVDERKIMLYSLIRSRRFEASDPRDKVYALLGIAGNVVMGKARYQPVYGVRSTADTYKMVAIQILLDSDDLLLLAHAEGEVFQTIPYLPSWVPDWSSTRVVGLGVTGYERFSAAGTLRRVLQVDEKSHTLLLSGKRIDIVTSTAESKKEILNGKPFPRLLSILCALPRSCQTRQPSSEVFWRTLLTDTAGLHPVHPAPKEYAGAFMPWFRARLDETASHIDDALLTEVLECLEADGLHDSTTEVVAAPNEDDQSKGPRAALDASQYEATFSHSPHLRAFLTRQKYFGVGSESLCENDEIWIITGSRVPLALRQARQGAFRLVGGTYVHGLMHGEALELGEPFREITLV